MNKRFFAAAPVLLALLLGGCGGGGSSASSTQLASRGGDVPAPQAVDTAAFIKLAQGETCADQKNRLWLIDGKEVFWDRSATKCPDNNWSRKLYGATPETMLCSSSDSIAGPVTTCANDSVRALFDTIQKNLDAPNLGLDATHKVEAIPFQYSGSTKPVVGMTDMAFTTLSRDYQSGVKDARTLVIKDQASWEKLWAEHVSIRNPAPPAPNVDFTKSMVVGVFLGQNGLPCGQMAIVGVHAGKGSIQVDYEKRHFYAMNVCLAALTEPTHLVVVDRSDDPVEFVGHDVDQLRTDDIDNTADSGVHAAREVVIKDQAAWAALWAEHAGTSRALPEIDFSKKVVVGVFLGWRTTCEQLRVDSVSTDGKQVRVSYLHILPPMGMMCVATVSSRAQLFAIDRTDLPVIFAKDTVHPAEIGQ